MLPAYSLLLGLIALLGYMAVAAHVDKSPAYAAGFNEVKDFGRIDSTVRTPQQTEVARFWAAAAGTPQIAGYWNEIAQNAATSQGNTLDQDARLFAELKKNGGLGLLDHHLGPDGLDVSIAPPLPRK